MAVHLFRALIAAAASALALSAIAVAPPPAVSLREVATGLAAPLEIANAHDGSGRLFIVEQGGTIRILRNGSLLATPFLDITARIASGGERGLLGLAFHPAYMSNRRFFVFYTMLPNDGTGGALRVSEFAASATNPDVADPASEREIITIPHPVNANHNGGHIAFGPDGYLYVGTGDGGSGGDPPNNAQTLSVLLGKLLRLDVDVPNGYAIPATNPAFAGVPGARREIWAYGLRNPWRYSFDRETHDLYIGDVGQGAVEEVDYVPMGTAGGLNFGWRVFEGDTCYNAATCSLAGHTPPVLVYHHDAAGGDSITGGYVYRGARSGSLRGYYLYGDYVSNRVWAAGHDGSTWATFELLPPPNVLNGISTFGEDENGELYVASHAGGKVYAIDGPMDGAATMTSPMAGTMLAGDTQMFQWTSAPGASLYQIWVGSTVGAFDLGYFPTMGTMGTSAMATGLPTDGRTLHVRLFTAVGGTYLFRDYTYTAAMIVPMPASIMSPANGSMLTGPSQLFQWNAAPGAMLYQLWVGNMPGGYDLGFFPAAGTMGTSAMATGLPTDGRTLYVRLWSAMGTQYQFRDFTYRAAMPAAPMPASIMSPMAGTMLAGGSQLFQWSAAPGATLYQLWVGSAMGMHDLGYFPMGGTSGVSTTATGLPMDGRTLYVRLWSMIGGTYYSTDAMFMAAGPASPDPATIMSPMNGSMISGSMQMFQWNAAPGAMLYQVWVGSSVGASDLGYFPAMGTAGTSATIMGLPMDGRTLYVRLWSAIGGTYYFRDFTYIAGP